MIDFTKVEEITMLYVDKEKLECNAYVQKDRILQINAENSIIKIKMYSEKNREVIDPFDIIIKKMDGRYWIKSDYFEENNKYYSMNMYEGDYAYILEHRYIETLTYIQIYV